MACSTPRSRFALAGSGRSAAWLIVLALAFLSLEQRAVAQDAPVTAGGAPSAAPAAVSGGAQTSPGTGPQAVPDRLPADPKLRAQEQRAAQLLMSLDELARIGGLSHGVGAITGIVIGGLTTAYGISVGVDGDELGQTSGRAALSGLSLTGGAVLIARGIYSLLADDNRDGERYERLKMIVAQGRADAETLARFEGEFLAEAGNAHAARVTAAVSSLAVAAGGGALIALGASDALEGSAQSGAFVVGGSLLGLGVLQSVTALLIASPHERAWARYQGMRSAAGSSLIRVSAVPVIGDKSFALRLQGSF